MATFHGKDGVVRNGVNPIAEVTGFSFEASVATVDDTAMGDSFDSHLVGTRKWEGSVDCFWDESDTNGQAPLSEGSSVTLSLYPRGVVTGSKFYTGLVTIVSMGIPVAKDGVVTRSFKYKGNGAYTESTVP